MHRLALVVLVLVLAACEKNDRPPPPSSGTPGGAPTESGPAGRPGAGALAEAERMFMQTCATCHGRDGTGNGPGAQALNPRPRNYTDPSWQASVTDEQIRTIILRGGQALGKSGMMPATPELRDRPAVLDGLVKVIRRFGTQQ